MKVDQYTLVLLSYDQNSSVGSTLKTDKIEINVQQVEPYVLDQKALVQNEYT